MSANNLHVNPVMLKFSDFCQHDAIWDSSKDTITSWAMLIYLIVIEWLNGSDWICSLCWLLRSWQVLHFCRQIKMLHISKLCLFVFCGHFLFKSAFSDGSPELRVICVTSESLLPEPGNFFFQTLNRACIFAQSSSFNFRTREPVCEQYLHWPFVPDLFAKWGFYQYAD